ncbi:MULTISPECIES: FAD-binding oxidoreductase [unclassified Leifsonia]|uniref:FAD-binding oxidoreductase n=1 Tax=unclassified Leifsonia TaxID=2663824 RepID=UPI00036EED0D|nr:MULTISPECIES: FAD-binding oxidoreductase [unclassified Leifsonia]TDP98585.1 FAD/FMN-containing dehydrogenase [Leifsonia sp. 115AMFTsu3.1]
MTGIERLRELLDGDVLTADSPGYDRARRPENRTFRDTRPALVVLCRSEEDIVRAIAFAHSTGLRLVPRGGGHCFAGRSSTGGIVLDLSALSEVAVHPDGAALIGAGARLGAVYRALHVHGRTLPAGCGPSVGIAGLTLGGGIGLLGRAYGLTCDRLLGARVVLADGSVVDSDAQNEPELFWALRGAGGGQFGVVTSLRFSTLPEPAACRIEAHWRDIDPRAVLTAWQSWAPDAPDELTLNATVERQPDGSGLRVHVHGASTLSESRTRELLHEFASRAGRPTLLAVSEPMPYSALKDALSDDARSSSTESVRIRSEFFDRPIDDGAVSALVSCLETGEGSRSRRLTFTALAGAYTRVAETATAFAHRGQRFLLEHAGSPDDPWIDASWKLAHEHASGRVYPNFPDPALEDPLRAYHGANGPRLSAVKQRYDPRRFFDFPQAVPPAGAESPTENTKEVHP